MSLTADSVAVVYVGDDRLQPFLEFELSTGSSVDYPLPTTAQGVCRLIERLRDKTWFSRKVEAQVIEVVAGMVG